MKDEKTNRSHARLAQAYVRPISCSWFNVHFTRDCAMRELVRERSSGGSAPECRGMRLERTRVIAWFMFFVFRGGGGLW